MTYTYPEAEFWFEFLTNEEIVYLILFTEANKKYRHKEIPIEILEIPYDLSLEDNNWQNEEIIIGFKDRSFYVILDISFKGEFIIHSEETYDSPKDESSIINEIDIDAITLVINDEFHDMLISKEIKVFAQTIFILNATGDISTKLENSIDLVRQRNLPLNLCQKIYKIREENEKIIQGRIAGKKYNV